MVNVREVLCKTVLSRSRIYGVDYSINPYIGCQHACSYCYARFMKKYGGHRERWGEFVDIKINALQIISKELPMTKRGLVLVSSVTDPYQPIEGKYGLTRKILQRLLLYNFPVSILTKSSMVTRDIDILREFSECEVGLTITTLDERVRENFEPKASRIEDRLAALKTLRESGIRTYVFLGPLFPLLADETLEGMTVEFKDVGVNRVLVDRMNIKYGNWETIKEVLEKNYPELLSKYEEILFSRSDYFEKLKRRVTDIFQKKGIELDFCY